MSKKSERARRRRLALLVLGAALMLGAPAAEARRLKVFSSGGGSRSAPADTSPGVPVVVPAGQAGASSAQSPAASPAPMRVRVAFEPPVQKVAAQEPSGPRAAVPVMGSAMRAEPAPTGFKPLN